MKGLKIISGLLLLTTILSLENCGLDIEETNRNFPWVKKGNQLTYDLNMDGKRVPHYITLDIVENPGARDNLAFRESHLEIQNAPIRESKWLKLFEHVYRLNDGLHTTACFKCGINPCLSVINYLIVPANPKQDQIIPDYLCGDHILTNNIVLSIDSVVTVPLGEFKTFVIKDTLNESIKFWNEQVGLIRVDDYNDHSTDTAKLELSKTNY